VTIAVSALTEERWLRVLLIRVLEIRVLRRRFGFKCEEGCGDVVLKNTMLCTAHQMLFGCKIKEHKIGGAFGTFGTEK
jgi:hypothetical protein